ncbi:MAG: (d)CMP kinase [Parachlamydiaceae bacterium]
MIITIDGPIATGKSTIAKRLAQELGYVFFDTGAMYRCLAYGVHKHTINVDDPQALAEFLKTFNFEIKIKHGDRYYYIDGEDITLPIRSPEVTAAVSKISALPAVREKLVALQKNMAVGVNAVFEGRDMGSVVFPNAQLKIFLTGRPEIRAARRLAEFRDKFPAETANLTLEQVTKEIGERDAYDMSRETSPLIKAPDAFLIDTSDLSLDEIIMKILECKDSLKKR